MLLSEILQKMYDQNDIYIIESHEMMDVITA